MNKSYFTALDLRDTGRVSRGRSQFKLLRKLTYTINVRLPAAQARAVTETLEQ